MIRTLALRTLVVVACLGMGAALAPAVCAADAWEVVPLDRNTSSAEAYRVHARVLATPGGMRPGGHGYVRVQVINPTQEAHRIGVTLATQGSGTACSHRRSFTVAAEGTSTVDLPLLATRNGLAVNFTFNGYAAPGQVWVGRGMSRGRRAVSVMTLTAPGGGGEYWHKYLEKQAARIRGGAKVSLYARKPAELPAAWSLLAGFDLVVVDGATLTPAQETLLSRYVASGGALAFRAEDAAADGALDRMRRSFDVEGVARKPRSGWYGLGRWHVLESAPPNAALHDWLAEGAAGGTAVLSRVIRSHAGGAPDTFWLPLQIPGVGAVPTGVFFILILLFAVVVGPVSYIYFRRRRRLPMLLVSIPLLGVLCTGAILGYGIFSEGFGVTGVVRSFTVLDQGEHVASSYTASTLYAGLQPSALEPRPESVVQCASFTADFARYRGRGSRGVLHVDLDAGYRMAGAILPSRTPTPFLATTVGRARQRLRFRRRADDSLELLAAPDFAPVSGSGSVLLRTKEGAYYLLGASGFLTPLASGAADRFEKIVSAAASLPLGGGDIVEDEYWGARVRYVSSQDITRVAAGQVSLGQWLGGHVPFLPPGSYLARMKQPPLREDYGLDIEYRAEEHVVLGLLGPEDVLDD